MAATGDRGAEAGRQEGVLWAKGSRGSEVGGPSHRAESDVGLEALLLSQGPCDWKPRGR